MVNTMNRHQPGLRLNRLVALIVVATVTLGTVAAQSQSLNIPNKDYGLSIGNSKRFTGVRFNIQDSNVEEIKGVNITLLPPRENKETGVVRGLSLGTLPHAEELQGVQLGLLGVGATKKTTGVSIGLLGAGSGEDMKWINIGGLAVGAGHSISGLNVGGVAVGAGSICKGINVGGVAVGAGHKLSGITVAGIAAGAGEELDGITLAGIAAGAGEELHGITLAGIAAGAPMVKGLTLAGIAAGGESVDGVTLALGMVQTKNNGSLKGIAVSAFNNVKGKQTGLSIGLFNRTRQLDGIQLGLINYVRDNPKWARILPFINANFNRSKKPSKDK